MNSRERMLAAMNRQPVDRVPTDIWATSEAWEKLRRHFGPDADLMAALHIDGLAGVDAPYVGPPLPTVGADETINYWGLRTRRVEHGTGAYQELSVHPLAGAATAADLDAYAWPRTEWFDYSGMRKQAEELRVTRVVSCGYMAPFFFHNLLRGLEQSLIDPLADPAFTHELVGRISDFFYAHHRRMFEACAGLIDVAQVTDDLGSQTGPLIGMDLYREFYAPQHQRFIDLCHEFGIKVFHHDDGSCRAFLPLLVEMGIDILNPVQWVCPGMDMVELKAEFGRRICFHGGIENQRILPFGTPDEVRAEVRHCIDALAADGTGYILAPCHNIQGNTPVENIIAMYDEAWTYGRARGGVRAAPA
jgi:uroporphyrinogen decarboxylase